MTLSLQSKSPASYLLTPEEIIDHLETAVSEAMRKVSASNLPTIRLLLSEEGRARHTLSEDKDGLRTPHMYALPGVHYPLSKEPKRTRLGWEYSFLSITPEFGTCLTRVIAQQEPSGAHRAQDILLRTCTKKEIAEWATPCLLRKLVTNVVGLHSDQDHIVEHMQDLFPCIPPDLFPSFNFN